MKKLLFTFFAAGMLLTDAYSYNPPAGGEDLNMLASPVNLSGANSVTGGALFDANANSILVNPALTAREQRVNLTAGYTFLYSANDLSSKHIGHAFQSGILIPFKRFIFSGHVDGTFAEFYEMPLGKSFNFRAGLSKEITDQLSGGLHAGGGFGWTEFDKDWSLYGDIGALYSLGNLGPFGDFRIGASVLNLGKTYTTIATLGIDEEAENTPFPTLATLKVGAAGTILDTEIAKIGLGLDFSVPCFQNLIIDFNAQVAFKNAFYISLGEKFNLKEAVNGKNSYIPSVSFLYKFSFNVKNNQYLEDNGWSQSEMAVSAGYKNYDETLHAISGGVDIDLGMADNEAPKIFVWDENE